MWFQATKGLIPMWRACQLAAEVARFDLTVGQARALDARLAPKVPILPWRRVLALARGLVAEIAADKTIAMAERARVARSSANSPPTTRRWRICRRGSTPPMRSFFDAMVDRIADILAQRGDTDPKDVRRAKAVGILATPERARLDSYEIPDWMRRQVQLRDTYEIFPYSSRTSRHQDLDHTIPYQPGQPDQTRASNLGPLSRTAHRGKTHGGWRLDQPQPGTFWWQSPGGQHYRVTPHRTNRMYTNPRFATYDQAIWNTDHNTGPPA